MAIINQPNSVYVQESPTWWEPQNIPNALIRELRRRKNCNNIGINYPTPGNPSLTVSNFEENHDKYTGPLTPWVRIFSNGTGLAGNGFVPRSEILNKNGQEKSYDGFILLPGQGFYDAFGYKQNGNVLKQDKAIIGYEANGEPHYIDTQFRSAFATKWPGTYYEQGQKQTSKQRTEVSPVLPPPALESLQIQTNKGLLAFGSFKFKCFSLAQLEYIAPFFLTPRINVFIELGWNLFNIKSLINLQNKQECWNLINTPKSVIDKWYLSYGNYGCITGIITKYEFNTTDGQIYTCNVSITSRQGFFMGMSVENNVSEKKEEKASVTNKDGIQIDTKTNEFTGLKTFIKTNFPKLKQVIENRKNFAEYIYENDSNVRFQNEKPFYGGKVENRIFIGRTKTPTVYKNPSIPSNNKQIQYSGPSGVKVLSYLDSKIDFDRDTSDQVWVQMDFLIEVVNKLCSNQDNKTFSVNVDRVVNAHPNLISSDPDILIPNAVAPKFNIGLKADEGYLPSDMSEEKNPFMNSKFDNEILDVSDPLYVAAMKTKTVFKTKSAYRDNLDTIINKLYYSIGNLNESDSKENASFPFKYEKELTVDKKDTILTDPKTKSEPNLNRKFEKYKFGNLKNIYVSVKKILEVVDNEDIRTMSQFLNAILKAINESSSNFWNFEVSISDSGGLSIVDNNFSYLARQGSSLKQIYMFEIGSTNSCIKAMTLNTSLTGEQATLTLFQAGLNKPKSTSTKISNQGDRTPSVCYLDRFDEFLKNSDGTGENNDVPSKTSLTVDKNELIARLQTYGEIDKVLNFTTVHVSAGQNPNDAPKNYVQLNLPPDLRYKLSQIIDDGDVKNNLPMYSGISPNFTISLTFDGIFGFRMFQHLAISNLPKPYIPENVIFMITDITHNITEEGGKWETVVNCMARCVAGQNIELIPV